MGTVVVLLVAAACSGAEPGEALVIDRRPAERARSVPLTLEEAGLLVSGALIDIYGIEADPVPVRVQGDDGELGGQAMWLLELVVDVDIDGARVEHRWRMWVGTPDGGEDDAAVLRALRTDP